MFYISFVCVINVYTVQLGTKILAPLVNMSKNPVLLLTFFSLNVEKSKASLK